MAITSMALRGAPALGVAAAFACAIWSENESEEKTVDSYITALDAIAEKVSSLRPTAVNLARGASRISGYAHAQSNRPLSEIKMGVVAEAKAICAEDEALCRAIGEYGASVFERIEPIREYDGEYSGGVHLMTHCNAGSLATAYFGTALGVIRTLDSQEKVAQVWVCETRPVNQGARLTTWELMADGIPSVLICDDMAADVMARGWVDAVIVGADRICANGDVANKIGTYGLACLATLHDIPFYVAAPHTTLDISCASGSDVKIEQRDPREVEGFPCTGIILPDDAVVARALDSLTEKGTRELTLKNGHRMDISRKGGAYAFDAWMRTTPPGVLVYNPAFDITPSKLITAIITDKGVFAPGEIAASVE